jgi:hypothetical protein
MVGGKGRAGSSRHTPSRFGAELAKAADALGHVPEFCLERLKVCHERSHDDTGFQELSWAASDGDTQTYPVVGFTPSG